MIPSLKSTSVFFVVLIFHSILFAQEISAPVDISTPEDWVIETIACQGNHSTNCGVIQNDLYLQAGDRVNEEEIENARLRMRTSGLFYDVQISLRKGSERGRVVLVIDVAERSSHYVNLGGTVGWYKSDQNKLSSGSLHIGDRNLFGLGKRLDVGFSKLLEAPGEVQRQNFSINYEDPGLFGSQKYFGSLGYDQNRSGDFDFESQTEQYEISAGRRVFDFSYIKWTHRLSKYKYRYNQSAYFYWSPPPSDSESKTTANTFEYGWNTKDDLFFPTSGSNLSLGVTYAQSETGGRYFLVDSYTHRLGSHYFLNLEAAVQSWPTGSGSQEVSFNYGANVARYWTFSRQGAPVPDKMKIFLGADMFVPHPHLIHTAVYRAGLAYLIDSFGELSFSLAYQGI
jgi:outer membrane protein assembly factor BamA